MICPECRKRPAKRTCAALGREICAVCCATRREVDIACPGDCVHLARSRRHPAASVRRQLDGDATLLMTTLGPLSERQLQVFFVIQSAVLAHRPEGLAGRLVDADVAQAAGALAGSLETASKGVIYEETSASLPAEGLRRVLKPLVEEIVQSGGSRAEREVAEVLRGIERGARHQAPEVGLDEASYLGLVGRVLRRPMAPPPPRVIA